ncbi:MAG: flagellar hook-associated protein FlgK [Acidobacteria bacterium]|nr:flagellar hook-associated protein FlgK [Acidobacteriota bacterium]
MSAMTNLPVARQKTLGRITRGNRDALAKTDLTKAFLSFTQAAGSLERSYAQLQAEVVRLTQELERANTELERSLEENLRVRRYLSRVLESLPCGVLVVNEQGEIQITNPEARKLLQVPKDWAPGDGGVVPESVERLLKEAPANSFFLEQEWTSPSTSGIRTIGILRANISDVPEGAGETIWIVRDKTEEKRLAADRESARRSHALAEVATVLAHEIRNPLGSMELFTGLLADATAQMPETRQWVTHLQAGLRGLSATSNNIANVNTPGYSRQRPDLEETPPVQIGGLTFGTGVQLKQVVSLRDTILDLRVNQETQQQGQLEGFLGPAQQIQSYFNETNGTGLQTGITAFFNSLSQLSTNPSDLNVRQAVLSAAQNLATSFNQTSVNLSNLRSNVNLSVTQSVAQINTLTTQIAAVNAQVSAAVTAGNNPGPFIDQRQQLLNQLSNLVGISEINAGNGSMTITTSSGAPLVVAGESFQLATQTNASGLQDVFSQGNNITAQITGGQLAGQLQVRDQEIPSIQNSLDTLAFNLSSAINTQHKAGFNLNGNQGGNLFNPLGGVTGSANQLSVAITDPKLIAASADGTAGDNSNANALLALQNQNIITGQTPLDFYGNLVFKIGNDVGNTLSNQQAGTQVLNQIQNLQGGVSNVDINEESANLIRFQNAYEASARVVTVINSLLDATISMVR